MNSEELEEEEPLTREGRSEKVKKYWEKKKRRKS
jgi:hypothetical protein